MSEKSESIHHHDDYTLTLTAYPMAQPQNASGTMTHITATVEHRHTRRPVEDIKVTFSSHAPHVRFSDTTVRTDCHGKAITRLIFPYPAQSTPLGGTIPVKAGIRCADAELLLVFYSPELPKVRITNLKHGGKIDEESIDAGIQAVIYPWPGARPGNIYTLFWGERTLQRAYDGTNLPWVVDISALFNSKALIHNGVYQVFYQVVDNAGNAADCEPLEVTCDTGCDSVPSLAQPLLSPATNKIITSESAKAGINITIPVDHHDVKPGDRYWLYLATKNFQEKPIKRILFEQGLIRKDQPQISAVPYEILQGYAGVYGDFYYEITHNDEDSRFLSHDARVIIDTDYSGDR